MQEDRSLIETFFDVKTYKLKKNTRLELLENVELEYLVHFAAPFTGGDKCIVPKGTRFIVTGPMRDDAFYLYRMGEDDLNNELTKMMTEKVKSGNYSNLFPRLQGFSFFITEEQLKCLPIKFSMGNRTILLAIISFMKQQWEEAKKEMGR